MLSQTKLRSDLTIIKFGYDPISLTPHSGKLVVVECLGCGILLDRQYFRYSISHSCPIIRDNEKRCYKCKEWKPLEAFYKVATKSGGVSNICRKCHNNNPVVKRVAARRFTNIRDSFLTADYHRYVEYISMHVIARAKRTKILIDIDKEYLLKLWDDQEGLCYYSNLPINGLPVNGLAVWNSPSVDRIIPELGYTKDNVVWCLYCINSFKGTMSVDELKKLLQSAMWWFQR